MAYAHKVEPGARVRLADYRPDQDGGLDKERGRARFAELNSELDALQEELYAAGQHSILVVLQGMDTSGKDGAIRKVFQNVDPQGCRVESFKVPTEEELAHDFLWRVHRVAPRRGMLAIFNRSHYEDVLVVRVHGLVPEQTWRARYEQINHFEQLLAANDTIIFKFFLHISKDEQEQRLVAREQDPTKAWKLAAGDWRERRRWDDYTAAYEDALSHCSTAEAPWYIVPANRKWYRDLAIAEALVERLKPYRRRWAEHLAQMSAARRQELEEFRKTNSQ
ncbi:MAG TPA: PPK2 family polyphosphate kinase [Roseiflexaceae bacterium]|nr:PPK2 family polyphosphate kinase [Roseiflexaceae bacterium]